MFTILKIYFLGFKRCVLKKFWLKKFQQPCNFVQFQKLHRRSLKTTIVVCFCSFYCTWNERPQLISIHFSRIFQSASWITYLTKSLNSSVIRQKGQSQNGCFKKKKHAKFPEKRTFLTPWYAHARVFRTYISNVRVRIRG